MKSSTTTRPEIHPRVERVSTYFQAKNETLAVHLYLLRGERNILIDTGIAPSPQRDILPSLRSLGLTLSDINLILNTHGHFDHTAGNAGVRAAGNAQILIHQKDALFLYRRNDCFENFFEPVIRAVGGDLPIEKKAFLENLGPETVPDKELNDGDVIDAGGDLQLKVIHLPGHSLGSVGFFWEKEGILFSGDSFGGLHVKGDKLPVILDLAEYARSIQRVKQMPVRLLLCSHDYRGIRLPPNWVRRGSEVNQFLEDSLEFAERLSDVVREVTPSLSGKSFPEIADQIITRLPPDMGFVPVIQAEKPVWSSQIILFALKQLAGMKTP